MLLYAPGIAPRGSNKGKKGKVVSRNRKKVKIVIDVEYFDDTYIKHDPKLCHVLWSNVHIAVHRGMLTDGGLGICVSDWSVEVDDDGPSSDEPDDKK